MVSHSGQKGRLQVLEVSSRSGLGWRMQWGAWSGTRRVPAALGSGAFGRKEARCKGQQKPESSGGVMLPGKNSSQVEPGLRGSWCQALGGLWQPPIHEPFHSGVTPETPLQSPSLVWAGFHQLEAFSPRGQAFRLGWVCLLRPPPHPPPEPLLVLSSHQEGLWAKPFHPKARHSIWKGRASYPAAYYKL